MVAAGRRHLPRGWADLGRQLAIWFGFAVLYQLARGFADRNPAKAFANGYHVVHLESLVANRLYELTFQNFVDQRHLLEAAVSWTYWLSEFAVLGLAVLWVYLRRHEQFVDFRNSILLANVIGLFGYIFVPTAPPRLLGVGFVDTHRDGLVNLAANPVRSDAEPACRRRDDRRRRPLHRVPSLVGEGALGALAGLGLLLRDGHRQPFLARLPRGHRRCTTGDGRRLQRASSPRVCRSSGVTDRLPTRTRASARRVVRSLP